MSLICTEPDCERGVAGRGLCSRHYQRLKLRERRELAVPDGEKVCKACQRPKLFSDFARHANCADGFRPDCKECHATYHREKRATSGRSPYWRLEIKKKYGLSPEAYDAMLADQNGKCSVCRRDPGSDGDGVKQFLCVDHDHATGQVRGLLCARCNTGIGLMMDNPEFLKSAAAYLLKWRS